MPKTPPKDTNKNTALKKWYKILKLHPEANFLQSPEWAKVNQKIGHKVIIKTFNDRGLVLAIIKDAKRGRYLEVPGGPLLDWRNTKEVKAAFDYLRKVARENHCAFIRFRPQLKNSEATLALMKSLGAKPASFHLHAEHTVLIDLTQSEEALLKNMRRQTRYEVRRSAKLDLTVTRDNSKEAFEEFWRVQTETAKRQKFIPPSLKDLLAYREAFGDKIWIYKAISEDTEATKQTSSGGALRSLRASDSGATPATAGGRDRGDAEDGLLGRTSGLGLIALGLIIECNGEADYFEAASTDLNRKLPGAYALQWQVIKDLKKQGIKRYNLWGIAPKNQPNHRYAGVTTFKTGFGGRQIEYLPAHDIVINPLRYFLTYLIETIRKKRRHLS